MIGRIASRIGGAMLAGVFALAGSGAAAPQGTPVAIERAQQECERAAAQLDRAQTRLQEALAAAEARMSVAPAIAAQASQRTFAGLERALAAAQRAADESAAQVYVSEDGPGWLGIRMEEVGSDKAKELKLPAQRGVLVTYVAEDSPAAKAGLKVNDVITEFDGQRVQGTMALQRMVHEVPAGRSVSLSFWRDARAQSLTVEIAARRAGRSGDRGFVVVNPHIPDMDIDIGPLPSMPPIPAIDFAPLGNLRLFGSPILGIDAEDLSGQLGSYFGAPDGQGVLVREVMPGTSAEKAGLKAGDVIVRVEGKRVKNAEELRSALREKTQKAAEGADSEKAPAPAADLTVLRAGKETTVRVEMQPPQRRVRPVRRVAV
ncbi:MAG TPA: PDZ domain-containing protein [Candidatus Acidoferrales bacterium]|nr:PDZ domain-containing protein [Candidatus Acidoferrales bacterium]